MPPPPTPLAGSVPSCRFTHGGSRYKVGYACGPDSQAYRIYDTFLGREVARYHYDPEGWAKAWSAFTKMQPDPVMLEEPDSLLDPVAPGERAPLIADTLPPKGPGDVEGRPVLVTVIAVLFVAQGALGLFGGLAVLSRDIVVGGVILGLTIAQIVAGMRLLRGDGGRGLGLIVCGAWLAFVSLAKLSGASLSAIDIAWVFVYVAAIAVLVSNGEYFRSI
jgi:hypothetical protein